MITSTRKCPSCGGNQSVEGQFGFYRQTFVPRGVWMFFSYAVSGAVCLGCGYVHHYLEEPYLTKLRKKARGSAADLR